MIFTIIDSMFINTTVRNNGYSVSFRNVNHFGSTVNTQFVDQYATKKLPT